MSTWKPSNSKYFNELSTLGRREFLNWAMFEQKPNPAESQKQKLANESAIAEQQAMINKHQNENNELQKKLNELEKAREKDRQKLVKALEKVERERQKAEKHAKKEKRADRKDPKAKDKNKDSKAKDREHEKKKKNGSKAKDEDEKDTAPMEALPHPPEDEGPPAHLSSAASASASAKEEVLQDTGDKEDEEDEDEESEDDENNGNKTKPAADDLDKESHATFFCSLTGWVVSLSLSRLVGRVCTPQGKLPRGGVTRGSRAPPRFQRTPSLQLLRSLFGLRWRVSLVPSLLVKGRVSDGLLSFFLGVEIVLLAKGSPSGPQLAPRGHSLSVCVCLQSWL